MKPKVILRHCERYEPEKIKQVILAGMDELGVAPQGRTMVKPNLVMPHARYFSGCYTRPEFMDGLLGALRERGQGVTDLTVGERSGITIPSRYAFSQAGYASVLRKHRARSEYFDEKPSVPVQLKDPQALRPEVYVPQALTGCDFLVNAPKFKMHSWLHVTFALKNFIGLQDDAHRLIDHDFNLTHKIVDLQEVATAGLIVIDGIEAGEYSEIAPQTFPLHLVVMGVNPVAVDAVCTHIAGLDPAAVEYIHLAAERGYGLWAWKKSKSTATYPCRKPNVGRMASVTVGFGLTNSFPNARTLTFIWGNHPKGTIVPADVLGRSSKPSRSWRSFNPRRATKSVH